ncbi:MAG TPA: ABC transporter permease [Vicinamibacterales bacterium]
MLTDFRFALRLLRKQPIFTAVTVLTLALGIGATSGVFSLIEGVLLTPPPYRDPGRLALVHGTRPDGHEGSPGWPAAQWLEWQTESRSIESLAAYGWTFNFLVLDESSESLQGMAVTGDYFGALGLQPVLGRTFSAQESQYPPAPVTVIGYDLWQRRFNGDPNIVGRPLRTSRTETPPTIIGVMPRGVRFLPSPVASQEPNYNINGSVDYWLPAAANPKGLKQPVWDVVVRLRQGVTLEQAQTEFSALAAREAQSDRDLDGAAPRLASLSDEFNQDGRRILLPLFGAAALVLLIACGNVAALLLVFGLQRQDEYAVRSALGSGRLALFRQVASESLLLALIGGAIGVALAFAIVRVFKVIGGHAIPRLDAVSAGWPVLACGLATAMAAALAAGLLPAWRASSLAPIAVLKSGGSRSSAGRGEQRLLRGVTIGQTALTLALLVGAGLLIRTMTNLASVTSGFRTDHIVTATVTAVRGDWIPFHRRALERVADVPGVRQAAFAWGVPLTGNSWPGSIDIEGQPEAVKAGDRFSVPLRAVTQGYFTLIGLPLVDGRDIRSTDEMGAPLVAVVNRAFVDRYFANASGVGKHLWFGGRQRPGSEIVGVVANGRTGDLSRPPEPEVYLSLWQNRAFSKDLVVRTTGDPRSVMAAVQRAIHDVDPTAAVEHVRTLDDIRGESLASRIFATRLLVGFAAIASLLTLIGIYGVLSLSVAGRRREIAIRAAVGAAAGDIRRLVFGEALRLIAGGVASGIVAALVLSRVLQSFLFEVSPTDPLTLAVMGTLFAAVALGACWLPTRRAARVDPIEALRCE